MFRASRAVGVAVALSSSGVRAEPPPGIGHPDADVKLTLEAPTTRGQWTVHVTNDGDVPVRIAADARMLVLDVTPRGARAPVRCELSDDMRPEGDLERPLVLPPGRSYAESFEARLFCFGQRRDAALAPGSIVVAHLGWPGKHPSSFEVSALDGVEPRVAAKGALDAPPIVLPDEATPPQTPRRSPYAPGAPLMSVSSSRWVEADSASVIDVSVSLRNDGSHAVSVRFLPEVLRFDVLGPSGVEHCAWPTQPGAPTREQFGKVAPGGSTELLSSLQAYCGSHTFDEPGLYFVVARADTRPGQAGPSVGPPSFEGELVASNATVLRLHKGRAPKPAPRPHLQEP
jgi:hypothetical protein